MSYIDTFDHEFIGSLGYLPLYHPLVSVDSQEERGHADFSATPDNLVLGGGGGEHPAIVIHNLGGAVVQFLWSQLTDEEDTVLSKGAHHEYLLDLEYREDNLEFCGWSVKRYAELYQMAQSKVMFTPLAAEESVENWILNSIGELVYFSMPDLYPEHQKITEIFKEFKIRATMRNVLCSPPGYPSLGGRQVLNGEYRWGLHRW